MNLINVYFGKYLAKVVKVNGDKVKVKCEKVYGDYESAWCRPCVPLVLEEEKFFYKMKGTNDEHSHELKKVLRVPKVGEEIWIEFEEGDPTKPIWVGTMKV